MEKKADLVDAMTTLQATLSNSAFDLYPAASNVSCASLFLFSLYRNVEVHDLTALMKRSITLGDALTRNPL